MTLILLLGCACTVGAAAAHPSRTDGERGDRTVQHAKKSLGPLPPAVYTGRFELGINEAFAVPARWRPRMGEGELAALLEGDAVATRALGARWVRGHTGNLPQISCDVLAASPGWAEMDLWVRTLGTELHGLAMLSPWPSNKTGMYTDSYVPADMAEYSACISSIVERYDGDGKDDMPGLVAPLHLWEFDNEPDLKNSNRPAAAERDYDPATFCTPREYATVLLATRKAMLAADPSAKLAALSLYRPYSEQGQTYGKSVLAQPGVAEAFDIVSLHTYHDDDGEWLAEAIESFRVLVPGKPIWITEASVTSAGGEEVQAGRVAAYVARAAAAGAERLFWHSLGDPPGEKRAASGLPPGHFSTNSLLRGLDPTHREEKPSGAVFRNLSAELQKDDLAGAVLDGAGGARLRSGAVLLYAGSATAPHGGRNLRTGSPIHPGEPATAPAWIDP